MKTDEAFWKFLPEGLDELFEMVKFEKTDQSYDIWLDEKKKLSDEDYRNPNIVSRGYTEYVTIQDYPMRGRPIYLHMRKNKWWDKEANKIFSYNLELPNEEGTRLSAEFVAFLKSKVETTALSIKHIAQMYCVNGKYFADLYRNKLSGYAEWRESELGCEFYFNADNIGPYMSLDETCLSNGETMRQILARSNHTLMMSQNKWTDIQRHRANILFKCYPILKAAYHLAMELRRIFNLKISQIKAMGKLNNWYEKVSALANNNFRSVIKTFKTHAPTILNYFRQRATNASAEAFNSKVKIFRSQMRGVRDRDFFIFRLVKLYA